MTCSGAARDLLARAGNGPDVRARSTASELVARLVSWPDVLLVRSDAARVPVARLVSWPDARLGTGDASGAVARAGRP